MRLLKELVINTTDAINEVFDEGLSPIRGLTLSVLASGADFIALRSGPDGDNNTLLRFQPNVQSQVVHNIGGPVSGPACQIEWGGTVELRRAVLRLWDEPIAPYGITTLRTFAEAAVAPSSNSAEQTSGTFGSWVRSVDLWFGGTRDTTLMWRVEAPPVLPTVNANGGSAPAGTVGVLPLPGSFEVLYVVLANADAVVASDVAWNLRAYLG